MIQELETDENSLHKIITHQLTLQYWQGNFWSKKRSFWWNILPVLLFDPMWLLSIPNYKNYKYFTERDAFWVFGGGLLEYVTSTKSDIRRCVPEMLPTVTENISFVYSCQRELLWKGQLQLFCKFSFNLQSHSCNFLAIPCTRLTNFLEQGLTWEGNNCSATAQIPHIYATQSFITVFTGAPPGPYQEPNKSNPHPPTLFL
jgi:hypothetical protein